MKYFVVLKDTEGFDISSDIVEGRADADKRARYLLSDEHAKSMGTTHKALGTHKVEVQDYHNGACIWDAFK